MRVSRKFVYTLVLLSLPLLQGCNKKRVALPPPAPAPTIADTLPLEIPLADATEEPTPPVATVEPAPPPPKAKPRKPAKTASTTAKKTAPPVNAAPAPPAPPAAQASQTVASLRPQREPAPETAIAAVIPNAQLAQQRDDTTRMVDATENALKGISRPLNDDEKAMRSQIQSYLQQSRKASTEGDFERAYNLAKKAQLLAEALTKK
jgi:outer membrane biosynthesis protein TonB